jgi:hypothetical protein
MLGIAVWAAARNALAYVSSEASTALSLPATGEEMLRCISLTMPTKPTVPQTTEGLAASR